MAHKNYTRNIFIGFRQYKMSNIPKFYFQTQNFEGIVMEFQKLNIQCCKNLVYWPNFSKTKFSNFTGCKELKICDKTKKFPSKSVH